MNFRNDYWTVTSGIGYIIDDKTDFYADYYFYCANDYYKNAAVAVPYGMGATENAVSATIDAPTEQEDAPDVEVWFL